MNACVFLVVTNNAGDWTVSHNEHFVGEFRLSRCQQDDITDDVTMILSSNFLF